MELARFFQVLRTVRHLRFSQVFWRLRYQWRRGRPCGRITVPASMSVHGDLPQIAVSHGGECEDDEFVDRLEKGEFLQLHQAIMLGRRPTDWLFSEPETDRLWRISLHYHAWAWRLASIVKGQGQLADRADLLLREYLSDWIEHCSLDVPGSRQLAWNAYAIGTRLGYWCRLYHLLGEAGRKSWGRLEQKFLASAWEQAEYLWRNVEWDLRGNHLLRDAVGLAWAGRFFAGMQAERWLKSATKLAVSQAEEQVLADGGHFERSPMYHVHVMEDLHTLAGLVTDVRAERLLTDIWQRMAEFLQWVRHPDGFIPLFNDGGLNGAPPPSELFAKGDSRLLELPRGGRWFDSFGLVVWHGKTWSVFSDVGMIGPDYQPGHAHADTLTLEVSYQGKRLIVDPGTFGYNVQEYRRYDRGTVSHNSVCIDGTNSSEVWDAFRVGRRARPIGTEVVIVDDGLQIQATHSGYDHLSGRPRHIRRIVVCDPGAMKIVDVLQGVGVHEVEGGLLIAPDWDVSEDAEGWHLRQGESELLVKVVGDGLDRQTLRRAYHPEYGREVLCPRLCWRGTLSLPRTVEIYVEPVEV